MTTVHDLWRAYQTGQGSADHSARQVFNEVIGPVLARLAELEGTVRYVSVALTQSQARLAEAERLLDKLEVAANTVDYCYRSRPENFAVALRDLRFAATTVRASRATDSADDALREAVIAAYKQGALDVHRNYQPDRDPDFTEAAHDYAAATVDAMEKQR